MFPNVVMMKSSSKAKIPDFFILFINIIQIFHFFSLIGNSTGLLKLQIAENYDTSSSENEEETSEPWSQNLSDDEEYMLPALKPLNPTRPLHMRGNSADSTLTETSEISRPRRVSPRKKVAAKMNKPKKLELNGGQELVLSERDINSFLHPTLNELRKSIKLQNKGDLHLDLSRAVTKAVVGYLGTIELPKENQVSRHFNVLQGFVSM